MRFVDILNIVQGRFICIIAKKQYEFSCKEDFNGDEFYKNHIVTSIRTENDVLIFELQPFSPPVADIDEEWVKEHIQQNGSEPSFF